MTARCAHCSSPVPDDAADARFCCAGCSAVFTLLNSESLGRYYELAGNQVLPAGDALPAQHAWLDALLASSTGCRLSLDVQGIHCAACVWLMNETFARHHGASLLVNPTLGTVDLSWAEGSFDPRAWVEDVERYGYRFGPPRKEGMRKTNGLPLRLGICAAITINVMLFSLSFYLGLTTAEPDVFRLFTWLSFGLSTITVIVGGWPFFRALRLGVSHLDLPIALGIALVYSMSVVQLLTNDGRGDLTYFDTLNTFITLMLLGRFLQERLLERNRRFLLEDDGADGILVRRIIGSTVETIAAPRVNEDDLLLISPGELIPVEAQLLGTDAAISADWMTGESEPKLIRLGATIRAGSFNASRSAIQVRAREPFADSALVRLLRAPNRARSTHRLWDTIARRWVAMVLGVSSLGLLIWLPVSTARAIDVAAALLVITCPCAIGIAIPLAYELTQADLRRVGFFARSSDLLDRLADITRIAFDKTGTLTLGRLELTTDVKALPAEVRSIAYNLAIRSSHPSSAVVARALSTEIFDAGFEVHEHAGLGLETQRNGTTWRLGRSSWARSDGASGGSVLTRNGDEVCALATREVLRPDARRELQALEARGVPVHLLSGDSQPRVDALAQTLGLAAGRAEGALTPEQKAQRIEALGDERTLYVGDGVNDALAFDAAHVAGTPAIDRPVMPGKSDFFLVGEGLAPLLLALDASHRLRRTVKRILAISLGYNVLAISATLAGLMTPVGAAILMPSSTLSLIIFAAVSITGRDAQSVRSSPAPRAALAH